MKASLDDDRILTELLEVWRTLLDQPALTADDNFFASGGRSLLALRLVQQVRKRLGVPVTLDTLVTAPTARTFAGRLATVLAERGVPPLDSSGPDRPEQHRQPWSGLRRVLTEAVDQGHHPGVQIYVSVAGEPVYRAAVGRREDGEPLGEDDLLPWFSAGKPLLAAAVCELSRTGLVDLDEPVATYLPTFASGGKEGITGRHLLSHSAGRLEAADPDSLDPYVVGLENAVRSALATNLHSGHAPGRQSSYSSSTAGWLVLSELVRQITGHRFDRVVAELVAGPVGMDCHYGFTPGDLLALGGRVTTYLRPRPGRHGGEKEAATARGVRRLLASGAVHTVPHPGDGLWASAGTMGQFYELVRRRAAGDSRGTGPLDQRTAEQMIRPQRPSFFDEYPMIDFGLGFTLETRRHGDQYMYYGSHVGVHAFGHQGHGSSPMAYADPDHELVVSFNGNGLPGWAVGKAIWQRVSDAVYQELGLLSPA